MKFHMKLTLSILLRSKILPCLFPSYCYFEEGCKRIPSDRHENVMVVSPHGSIRAAEDKEPYMMYENKCKSPEAFSKHAFYKIPKYCVVQLPSEMKTYDCQKLLFTCWSEISQTAFIVDFDDEVWCRCWNELECLW